MPNEAGYISCTRVTISAPGRSMKRIVPPRRSTVDILPANLPCSLECIRPFVSSMLKLTSMK